MSGWALPFHESRCKGTAFVRHGQTKKGISNREGAKSPISEPKIARRKAKTTKKHKKQPFFARNPCICQKKEVILRSNYTFHFVKFFRFGKRMIRLTSLQNEDYRTFKVFKKPSRRATYAWYKDYHWRSPMLCTPTSKTIMCSIRTIMCL